VWLTVLTEVAEANEIDRVGSAGESGPALRLMGGHKPELLVAEIASHCGRLPRGLAACATGGPF
jgi:hypothetical protein